MTGEAKANREANRTAKKDDRKAKRADNKQIKDADKRGAVTVTPKGAKATGNKRGQKALAKAKAAKATKESRMRAESRAMDEITKKAAGLKKTAYKKRNCKYKK